MKFDNGEDDTRARVAKAAHDAQLARLDSNYKKAQRRAQKKGRSIPARDQYYGSYWGYPYMMYGPWMYPMMYYPGMYYGMMGPGIAMAGAGYYGACAAGTCGGEQTRLDHRGVVANSRLHRWFWSWCLWWCCGRGLWSRRRGLWCRRREYRCPSPS